jgi:hypothetical protein
LFVAELLSVHNHNGRRGSPGKAYNSQRVFAPSCSALEEMDEEDMDITSDDDSSDSSEDSFVCICGMRQLRHSLIIIGIGFGGRTRIGGGGIDRCFHGWYPECMDGSNSIHSCLALCILFQFNEYTPLIPTVQSSAMPHSDNYI